MMRNKTYTITSTINHALSAAINSLPGACRSGRRSAAEWRSADHPVNCRTVAIASGSKNKKYKIQNITNRYRARRRCVALALEELVGAIVSGDDPPFASGEDGATVELLPPEEDPEEDGSEERLVGEISLDGNIVDNHDVRARGVVLFFPVTDSTIRRSATKSQQCAERGRADANKKNRHRW